MHINDLPDDGLRAVFDVFSLQQLIQLRAVCPRWRTLVDTICARKSCLKLFESLNVVYNYCNCLLQYTLQDHEDFTLKDIGRGLDDDLLLAGRPVGHVAPPHGSENTQTLTESTGLLLTELFPSLSKLVFYYYNWPTEMELHTFLGKWTHLSSLALLGMPHKKEHQGEIWRAINSLQLLDRLHLFEIPEAIPDTVTVFCQLEQLTLVNYDGDLVGLLSRLGPGIRHLVLDGVTCTEAQFGELLKEAPQLPANLTHLTIGNLFCGEESLYKSRSILKSILHLLCTAFRSLQYFYPKFAYQLPLAEQIAELCLMENLTELQLYIHSFQMRLDPEQSRLLAQLATIRTLNLDYAVLDMDVNVADFANLVPRKFSKVTQLNVTVEYHDAEYLAFMQRYFTELQSQVGYSVNFKDSHLTRYMGRHRERYLAEFENAN